MFLAPMFFLLWIVALAIAPRQSLALEAPVEVGVGLQAFGWKDLVFRDGFFKYIRGRTGEFADLGFTHVWLPPATSALDSYGYLPLEWYSIVGAADFAAANAGLRSRGVMPVCDVVLNHRAGKGRAACNGEYIVFENPNWNSSAVVSDDWKCGTPGACSRYCTPPCQCGNKDSGQNYVAAPDIDHTNKVVQDDVIAFLKFLQADYGCEGFRFDMAGGYAGSFLKMYMDRVGAPFGVGEHLSLDTANMLAWAKQSGRQAFDYPGRFAVKNALDTRQFAQLSSFGKMPGLAGYDIKAASTFVDNHDTTNPDCPVGDGGFSDAILMYGYAYILTHPPFPWVFRAHLDGPHREEILNLMAIRARAGVSPADTVGTEYTAPYEQDLYAAYINGDMNTCNGKLAIKLGPRVWKPCGTGWTIAARGAPDWIVWERRGGGGGLRASASSSKAYDIVYQ